MPAYEISLIVIFTLNLLLFISVVFLEYKDPTETMMWLAITAALPIVGYLLYVAFGNTLKLRRIHNKNNRKLRKQYLDDLEEQAKDLLQLKHYINIDPDLASIIEFNYKYNHSALTLYNDVEIFTNGKQKYPRLFEDIKNAKNFINVEYYTIHNDSVGKEFARILTEKAKEGVEVNVLYDGFGNMTPKRKLFKELMKCGGKVEKSRQYMTRYRNHRKIVVIDGKIGYMGGMNIGTQYQNEHKKKTPWRDTHIRIVGELVDILNYHFLNDWVSYLPVKESKLLFENLDKYFAETDCTHLLPAQIVVGGAYEQSNRIKSIYLKMMHTAQHRLWIQSPYCVPDESLFETVKILIASGVDVRFMLPKVSASFFLSAAGNYYIEQLLKAGATVYQYHGYIHAKTIIVDHNLTGIGSVNFDIGSMELNDEIIALFYGNEFTPRYEKIFLEDIKSCTKLDYETFKNRPIIKKLWEKFMWLFTPLY